MTTNDPARHIDELAATAARLAEDTAELPGPAGQPDAGPPDAGPQAFSVGSEAALLSFVPVLLGFQPSTGSLVVVGLAGPRSLVKVTLRYDLDSGAPADIALHAAGVLAGADVAECAAVIYAPDGAARPAAAALRAAGLAAGLHVPVILRVEGNRYWSCMCGGESCCPADGTPFDPAVTASLGAAVLASRDKVAAGLQPAAAPRPRSWPAWSARPGSGTRTTAAG